MSFLLLVQMINLLSTILTVLIFAWVVASWIAPPYHPIREALERIVEPMLAPIRRVMPMTGPIDFSPMVLLLLIYFGTSIINRILLSL
jgi:YggT family protein